MWDVARSGTLMWQVHLACCKTGGRIMFDMAYFGQMYGATWPSLGLPRGTPPLVDLFGKLYGLPGSRTRDLRSGGSDLAGSGYQPAHMCLT
jgi:hypothetical protein